MSVPSLTLQVICFPTCRFNQVTIEKRNRDTEGRKITGSVRKLVYAAYNFVTKEPTLTLIISGTFYCPVCSADADSGGDRFMDDGGVETVVTRRLITWKNTVINMEYDNCFNRRGDYVAKQ